MADKLNIVIHGAESTLNRTGNLPTVEELNSASKILSNKMGDDSDLNVMITGYWSLYACRLACGENGPEHTNYIDDSLIVKSYFDHEMDGAVTVYPDPIDDIVSTRSNHNYHINSGSVIQRFKDIYRVNGVEPEKTEGFVDFRHEEEHTLYIMYSDKPMSSYEMMSHFDDFNMKNKYFINRLHSDRVNLLEVVEQYCSSMNGNPQGDFLPIYNPWSGDKMGSNKKDSIAAKSIVQDMCEVIYHYLNYNVDKSIFNYNPNKEIDFKGNLERFKYEKTVNSQKQEYNLMNPMSENPTLVREKLLPLVDKNIDPPFPSWIMNPETLCIKGALLYYGLHPFNMDTPYIITMVTHSGYRKALLNIMISAVSNFCINNNLLTIEKVKSLGMWHSKETYQEISNAVSTMIG